MAMSSSYPPLVAMCHEAVKRIRAGESRYEEELDRLCEQLDEEPENVRPTLDRIMAESNRKPEE
jgi:hypothetical protein